MFFSNNLRTFIAQKYHLLLRTRPYVSFHNYGELSNEQCGELGNAIAGSTTLKRMAFYLSNNIDNTKLSRILKGVELCKGLIELKLHRDDLNNNDNNTKEAESLINVKHYLQPNQLQQISNMIKTNVTIKTLSLNNVYVGLNAGKECLFDFCKSLKMNEVITDLDITFFIAEETLAKEREDMMENSPFYNWTVEFNEAICEMKQLKSLSVRFRFYETRDGTGNVTIKRRDRKKDKTRDKTKNNTKIIQTLVKHMLHLQSKGLHEFHLDIKCPLTKNITSLISNWITSKSTNLKHLTIQCISIEDKAMEELGKSISAARSKLEEFILLSNHKIGINVQKRVEHLYVKLKQLKVNKLHICLIAHKLAKGKMLDFTAPIEEIDYPGAFGRWARFIRISRSAWNAVFGTLFGTIEFMLETYRKMVYTVNEVFVKGAGVFIDVFGDLIRNKESLSWYFIFHTIELLIVAIGESNKKNIRKAMLHVAAIYQTNNYAFSLMYFNDMDEAEGANLVKATCQYLYGLFRKDVSLKQHLYLAFDNLELRHTVMDTITVLLKTHIVNNISIKAISFQNHYFGRAGMKLLANCLANNEPNSNKAIFTLDISQGKVTWDGIGGLKNLIEAANIYSFKSDDGSGTANSIQITEFERKYVLFVSMMYVICFSTSILTNWLLLRENTMMIVDVTMLYLPLLYIGACINSIAMKILLYSKCICCLRYEEINVMSQLVLVCSFNAGIIIYLYFVDAYFLDATKFVISIILLILPAWFSLRCVIVIVQNMFKKCCYSREERRRELKVEKLILSDAIDMDNPFNIGRGEGSNIRRGEGVAIMESVTTYYNGCSWSTKSADYILLLLQRNTNKILDVSNQNIDDEGLMLIHFFLTFNKKLKVMIQGFNLLGNEFTENGFQRFSKAIDDLYKLGNDKVKTYCGVIDQQVYDDTLMETLSITDDVISKVDLDVIGQTLMLNGKFRLSTIYNTLFHRVD